MGEYATITRAGRRERVKIGTCNFLYFLRYDQRDTVEPCADSSDFRKDIQGVWFRLPRQEEEGSAPGSFGFCGPMGAKPIALYVPDHTEDNKPNPIYAKHLKDLEQLARDNPGTIQVSTPNGVLVDVPCGHGHCLDLPAKMFYNGHNAHQLAAFAVGIRNGVPVILVGCKFCRQPLAWYDCEEFLKTFRPFYDDIAAFEYLREYMQKMEREGVRHV